MRRVKRDRVMSAHLMNSLPGLAKLKKTRNPSRNRVPFGASLWLGRNQTAERVHTFRPGTSWPDSASSNGLQCVTCWHSSNASRSRTRASTRSGTGRASDGKATDCYRHSSDVYRRSLCLLQGRAGGLLQRFEIERGALAPGPGDHVEDLPGLGAPGPSRCGWCAGGTASRAID